jgi:hypothetical protein
MSLYMCSRVKSAIETDFLLLLFSFFQFDAVRFVYILFSYVST